MNYSRWMGVLIVTAATGLTGCVMSRSYTPICGPASVPEPAMREVLSHGEWQTPRRKRLLGRQFVWLPLIFAHYSENALLIGGPESAASESRRVNASDAWAVGPLASLCVHHCEAGYQDDGRILSYSRRTVLVWGILWYDSLKRTSVEPLAEDYRTGLLWAGFGYDSSTNAGGMKRHVRFLWIPIPVS